MERTLESCKDWTEKKCVVKYRVTRARIEENVVWLGICFKFRATLRREDVNYSIQEVVKKMYKLISGKERE